MEKTIIGIKRKIEQIDSIIDYTHDNKKQDSSRHIPTLFISIQTGLIPYLEFIQKLTETHIFDTAIKHERDFRIKSPIHIIHDHNIEKNHVSITVKCFHKIRGAYNNKTLVHVSFLPNKLEHLEKEFSNKSMFDTEDRLILIHGDFSPWTISPYRRIAINRYWPDNYSDLEDLIHDFNPKTDIIILDLGHEYNIDRNLEDDLNHIQKQLNGDDSFNGLFFLVPQSKQENIFRLPYFTRTDVIKSTGVIDDYAKKITFHE